MAIPSDFIKLVLPTAFVPYNNIPLLLQPIERSFDTYNSLLFKCSIKQCLIFLKLTYDLLVFSHNSLFITGLQ